MKAKDQGCSRVITSITLGMPKEDSNRLAHKHKDGWSCEQRCSLWLSKNG